MRIITGHNNLNFFQNKLGYTQDPGCRLCEGGLETITHYMTSCPALTISAREILGAKIPDADMKWSVRKMIDFSYIPAVNKAFEGNANELSQCELEVTMIGLGGLDTQDD